MERWSWSVCQDTVLRSIADPSVADEDIPDTARLPPKGSDEEETPKKPKKASKKAKAEVEDDSGDEKPKKGRKSVEKSKPKVS